MSAIPLAAISQTNHLRHTGMSEAVRCESSRSAAPQPVTNCRGPTFTVPYQSDVSPVAQLPDCFGEQGGAILGGESPKACLDCQVFEKCHKITVAATLQAIATDLDLIVQSGLRKGTLEGFDASADSELEEP